MSNYTETLKNFIRSFVSSLYNEQFYFDNFILIKAKYKMSWNYRSNYSNIVSDKILSNLFIFNNLILLLYF